MPAPRIVHLAGYSAPYGSSFVYMARAVLRGALRRGWSAELVFEQEAEGLPWVADVEADGIRVRFMPVQSRRRLRALVDAMLDESDAPTLLHTHYTVFDIASALAGGRRPGVAVVWHLRTRLVPGWKAKLRNRPKFGLVGRRVDMIFGNAPDMVEEAIARGAPAARTEFLANPIDTSRFPVVTPDGRRRVREELGLPQERPVLLHFGWLWETKGGDLFLEAVRRLVDDGHDVLALSVGGGGPAHALGRELGLEDRVVVLPFQENVQRMYAAADVFVACSRAEGMTFSLAEALCSGLGVVASDIPGQSIQSPTSQGRKLVALEPGAIAAAAAELLARSPEQAVVDTAAARAWIEEHQGVEGWAERLLDRYAELLRLP